LIYFADALLLVLTAVAAVTDLKSRKIRNWLVYPAIAGGMANALLLNGLRGAGESFMGIAAGTALLVPFFFLGGIGAGDVKLAAAAGAIKGWNFALHGVFAGSALAGMFCIIVLYRNGTLLKSVRKIRDFLVLLLALKTVVPIDKKESIFIPFGFFLCLGFLLAEIGAVRFF